MASTPLARLLARQDGLITLAQAAEHGISRRSVGRRVESGVWTRVAPRVHLVHGERFAPAVRVRAASLWSEGVVCGMAAAWCHDLVDRPGPIVEVTVSRSRHPGRVEGVRVRRRDLDPRDVTRRRGMAVLAAPLAVLEVAIAVPDGATLVDSALRRRIGFDDLLSAYRRAMGSTGSARMRELVVAAADRADSRLERMLFQLLRAAGITGWTRNVPFRGWFLDIAFVEARLVIETDGWAWHVEPDRFQTDRRKQNALVEEGWTVLRFTWKDITTEPGAVVARIRRVLAAPPRGATA
ncbi:type IV toxin-antitoxin system AbiEi family antitoxin domain-containing protein [Pseudonocardia xishanensis]